MTADKTRTFDDRTEKNLATLLPAVVPTFRAFLADANDTLSAAGLSVRVTDGSRTYAQQDALYAQGRTKPGAIVTEAKGGESHHNFGIAVDVGLFRGGAWIPESPVYKQIGAIAKRNGLDWGGDWTTPDEPHVEFPTGLTLAQLRDRVAKGVPIVHVATDPVPQTKTVTVEVNGKEVSSDCRDTPSVRATAEALGARVDWDGVRKAVVVTAGKLGL